MDIGEGMCYGECCEVCKPGDSQTCTPGANNTLYVYKKQTQKQKTKQKYLFLSPTYSEFNIKCFSILSKMKGDVKIKI